VVELIRPSELVFSAPPGESAPGSQDVFVYNPTADVKSFRSVRSIAENGAPWFTIVPSDALVQPDRPTRILVQPFTTGLAPGIHKGTATLQFSDGHVLEFDITLAITGSAASPSTLRVIPRGSADDRRHSGPLEANDCSSSSLIPALISAGKGFNVPAAWPQALQADVRDNCGRPLESGTVVAEFSNGDPPVNLISLGSGRWDATWRTGNSSDHITIILRARDASGALSGIKELA